MRYRSSLSILINLLKMPGSISVCHALDLKMHNIIPYVQTSFPRNELMILAEYISLYYFSPHCEMPKTNAKNTLQQLIGYMNEKLNDEVYTRTDTGVLRHTIEQLPNHQYCECDLFHDSYQLNDFHTDESCSITKPRIGTLQWGKTLLCNNDMGQEVEINKSPEIIWHDILISLLKKCKILFSEMKPKINMKFISNDLPVVGKKMSKCICKIIWQHTSSSIVTSSLYETDKQNLLKIKNDGLIICNSGKQFSY